MCRTFQNKLTELFRIAGSVLKFGFDELGLNRIGLGVFYFNKPAIKCYKNMGFKLEGTLRDDGRKHEISLILKNMAFPII
jgi:RimJ/RimL family protein N-acetyltransferase